MYKSIAVLVGLVVSGLSIADADYAFGVIPGLPPVAIEKRFGPLTFALSQYLGNEVAVKTRSSYSEYANALANEEFDIAMVDGITFLKLLETTEYRGLVRKQGEFHAALLSFKPGITSIADLRGKEVAFPAEEAAVTRLVTKLLKSEGFADGDYTPLYHDEHASCLFAAINGSAAACATSFRVSQELRGDRTKTVKIVAETSGYPQVVLVIGRSLETQYEQIRDWFLHLDQTANGAAVLRSAFLDQVTTVNPIDYETLREFLPSQ